MGQARNPRPSIPLGKRRGNAARNLYQKDSTHSIELETHILPVCQPSGTGYVAEAIHSARHACNAPDYAAVIQSAIALGNDTDTTACIAGGIAGIRHGKSGIPAAWLESFRGTEILDPLLDQIPPRTRHGATAFPCAGL